MEKLKKDLFASIVVLLVALPLCMGIAIASGVPPAWGLVTGIAGGLVVGKIAGCPLQVSGPSAALAVIVWQIVQEHGLAGLGLTVLIAGLIQLVSGIFKLGQWFRAVSPAVINGMLSGIGLLILSSQLLVMLESKPVGTGLENILALPNHLAETISLGAAHNPHIAGIIGLVTIATIVFWQFVPWKFARSVPGALVSVCVATILCTSFSLDIKTVSVPNDVLEALAPLNLNNITSMLNTNLIIDAIVLAFVSSAQTLLTATAVDKMHRGPRTKYDRELTAQGVGNIICGFLGCLPLAGVIVRSSANVQAGAETRNSAIMHGLWLAIFVLMLPFVLRLIPTACLAAILVYTGYKLLNFSIVKSLLPHGKSEVAIYCATVFTIFAFDLMLGIVVGIALSAAKLLYLFSHIEIEKTRPDEGKMIINLHGSANFLSLPKLASALEDVPVNTELHVRIDELDFIDHACLDMIMSWEEQHKSTGGHLVIDWGALGSLAWRKSTQRRQHLHIIEGDAVTVEEPAV